MPGPVSRGQWGGPGASASWCRPRGAGRVAPAWGRRGPPTLARTAGGRFCRLHPSRWHHSANSRHTREPREGDAKTSPSDIISFLKGSPQSYSFNSPVFLSDGVVTFYIVRSRLLICTCFKDFFPPFSGLCVGQPSSLARFTILYLNATFSLFFLSQPALRFGDLTATCFSSVSLVLVPLHDGCVSGKCGLVFVFVKSRKIRPLLL